MTLGEAMGSRRSSTLDLMRLLLAVSVIVSHAWPLALGPHTPEPLETLTGRSLGGWAVGLFFFLSGLLVTGSAQRGGKVRFWRARARRILPGLSVALLVTLALALVSGSSAGFSETVVWYLRALSLVSIEHRLTGAFAGNPIPEVVNGPLWSLFYEVLAYCLCACFVWMGGARSNWAVSGLLVLAVVGALTHDLLPGRLNTFAPLLAAFAFGLVLHIYREIIPLNAFVIILGSVLAILLPWQIAVGPVGLIMLALVLRAPAVQLESDTSFGMYIYGWPVSQAIVQLLPAVSPALLATLTLVSTFPLAYLSWHFVERPSLPTRRSMV